MADNMMSSEMAGLLSLGLVLDGWLFTGPLDKAFPSVFLVFVFGIWDFGMLVFFFVIVSLSKLHYTFWYSVLHTFALKSSLTHSKVCSLCCFWCSRISFYPLLTALHSLLFSLYLCIWLRPAKPHGGFFGLVFPPLLFLPPSTLSLHLSPLLLCIFLVSVERESRREWVWSGGNERERGDQ